MYVKNALLVFAFFISLVLLTTDCGAQSKKTKIRPVIAYNHFRLAAPPGMIYIPGGSTSIKYSQSSTDTNSIKKVSLDSYFIDKTEVSNGQYRQFTEWVIDSIAIVQYLKDDKYFNEDNSSAANNTDSTRKDTVNNRRTINWSRVDHKKIFINNDEETRSKILPMLDEKGKIKKEFYMFNFVYDKAGISKQNKLIVGENASESINVYPDELIWAKDFPNSQTDILVENYFTTPPYDDYPVVGVTWKQARAYCYWRTITSAKFANIAEYMKYYRLSYHLPTEAQWVYAAQADLKAQEKNVVKEEEPPEPKPVEDSSKIALAPLSADSLSGTVGDVVMDPDSVHVARDKNGILANFKQQEGDYSEDGAAFTVPVMSYAPNDYGVYNMVGNVSEWVIDAYSPSTFAFVSDVNPVLLYDADSTEAEPMKRKVVRGGSFVSNGKALSPYARDYEQQDVSHSYIGFRCTMQAPNILDKKIATRRKTTTGKKNKFR